LNSMPRYLAAWAKQRTRLVEVVRKVRLRASIEDFQAQHGTFFTGAVALVVCEIRAPTGRKNT
jgi:hypothetical protein